MNYRTYGDKISIHFSGKFDNFQMVLSKTGSVRESNPGPLAPKARIMPLDQQAGDIKYGLGRVFYSLLLLERVD